MLTLACDLLNTVLNVKNRMVVRVWVVWRTGTCGSPLPSIMTRKSLHSATPRKDQNSRFKAWFLPNAYRFHIIIKPKYCMSDHRKLGIVCAMELQCTRFLLRSPPIAFPSCLLLLTALHLLYLISGHCVFLILQSSTTQATEVDNIRGDDNLSHNKKLPKIK